MLIHQHPARNSQPPSLGPSTHQGSLNTGAMDHQKHPSECSWAIQRDHPWYNLKNEVKDLTNEVRNFNNALSMEHANQKKLKDTISDPQWQLAAKEKLTGPEQPATQPVAAPSLEMMASLPSRVASSLANHIASPFNSFTGLNELVHQEAPDNFRSDDLMWMGTTQTTWKISPNGDESGESSNFSSTTLSVMRFVTSLRNTSWSHWCTPLMTQHSQKPSPPWNRSLWRKKRGSWPWCQNSYHPSHCPSWQWQFLNPTQGKGNVFSH